MASNAICESPLPLPLVPLFFLLSSARRSHGRRSRWHRGSCPFSLAASPDRAMGGLECRWAGGRPYRRREDVGLERWAVVQSVSPSFLRAFVRPTLSLYSSDASIVGIHTSATLIRVSTCSHIMWTNIQLAASRPTL